MNIRKIYYSLAALMISFGCAFGLAACGKKDKTDTISKVYYQCNETRGADANGWVSRYDFANAGLSGLTTMGLTEKGNDYLVLANDGFLADFGEDNLLRTMDADTDTGAEFLGQIESCVKFADVSAQEFTEYCEYLFNDYGANMNKNGEAAGGVNALIRGYNNNALRIKARIFEGWYEHDGENLPVVVYYFHEGFNHIVEELDMYVNFPLAQQKPTAPATSDLGTEITTTWPLYESNLAFGGTVCNRNNVPTIYSPYYETNFNFMYNRIFVPDYTADMEEFYEKALADFGYEKLDTHSIVNAYSDSEGVRTYLFDNRDKVKVYRLAETRVSAWVVGFAEQNGHLLIVPWVEYSSAILGMTYSEAMATPYFGFDFDPSAVNGTYDHSPVDEVFDYYWGDMFGELPELDGADEFKVSGGDISVDISFIVDFRDDNSALPANIIKFVEELQAAVNLSNDFESDWAPWRDGVEDWFASAPTVKSLMHEGAPWYFISYGDYQYDEDDRFILRFSPYDTYATHRAAVGLGVTLEMLDNRVDERDRFHVQMRFSFA